MILASISWAVTLVALIVIVRQRNRKEAERARIERLVDRIHEAVLRERGFLLLEVVVVMALMAIIMGMALPSFAWLALRQDQSLADSNLQEGAVVMERLRSTSTGYSGITTDALHQADSSILDVQAEWTTAANYCLSATERPVVRYRRADALLGSVPC